MSENKCQNCRWWHGEREQKPWTDDPEGPCERIHVGGGNREARARIYPVGGGGWLETHFKFSCSLFEKVKASD